MDVNNQTTGAAYTVLCLSAPSGKRVQEVPTLAELRDRLDIIGDIYLPRFSLFPNAYTIDQGRAVNLLQVAEMMRSDQLADLTDHIRRAAAEGNKRLKNQLKKRLPVITQGGLFLFRRNHGLALPSFVWQLDIDERLQDTQRTIDTLLQDVEITVLMASVSPSGTGVKALLWLRDLMFKSAVWQWPQYADAFHDFTALAARHFQQTHGLKIDTQVKAICQPFYLLHSQNLYIHPDYAQA